MESMACGVANIVPNHSALAEWANGGVIYTENSDIPYYTTNGLNTRALIPTRQSTLDALELLYTNKEKRKDVAQAGLKLVSQNKYQWKTIAKQFDAIFKEYL